LATKSKLDKAVDEAIEGLNEAQKELVRSQLSVYKQNKARMAALKDQQAAVDAMTAPTFEELRAKQAQRSTLSYEYNQLATANSRIAADIFEFLKE